MANSGIAPYSARVKENGAMRKCWITGAAIVALAASSAHGQAAKEDQNMQGYVMALQCATAYVNAVPADKRVNIPEEGAHPFWQNLLKSLSMEVYRNWENDLKMQIRLDYAESQVVGQTEFSASNLKILTYCQGLEEKVKAQTAVATAPITWHKKRRVVMPAFFIICETCFIRQHPIHRRCAKRGRPIRFRPRPPRPIL